MKCRDLSYQHNVANAYSNTTFPPNVSYVQFHIALDFHHLLLADLVGDLWLPPLEVKEWQSPIY